MSAVLGIDAAWTVHEPSGVALLERGAAGWRCIALAPSYAQYLQLAAGTAVDWAQRPLPSAPDPGALLAASRALLHGRRVSVVAVDMPLYDRPFAGHRNADRAIARAFGRRGCAVHAPLAGRPGALAVELTRGFAAHGFSLATALHPPGSGGYLLEVYPHPALLCLLGAPYRIPYKVSRRHRYWPGLAASEQKQRLAAVFRRIAAALQREVKDVKFELPAATADLPFARLKRYEDALDALICAWVGTRFLAAAAQPYGDAAAAIWVPSRCGATTSRAR